MGCMSSKILPGADETIKSKPKKDPNPNIILGDVSLKTEAKLKREKSMRERMQHRAVDAEEISKRIMEEKERLSLEAWSHATSRETSRTVSPVNGRKQVHFSSYEKEDGKSKGKREKEKKKRSNEGVSSSTSNITFSLADSVTENHQHLKPGDIPGTTAVVDSKDHNNEKSALGTIEERTSSRASGKIEFEPKRG